MPGLNFKAKMPYAAKTLKIHALATAFLFFSSLAFAENGTRFYENDGGFSYCPPSGWKLMKFSDENYRVAVGPLENGVAADISFFDEEFDGDVHSYVDEIIDVMGLVLDDYVVLHRDPFTTNAGLAGERVISTSTHKQNVFYRQIHYFLQAPKNKMFTIDCGVLDSVAEKYLSLFEDSVKTFEFIE